MKTFAQTTMSPRRVGLAGVSIGLLLCVAACTAGPPVPSGSTVTSTRLVTVGPAPARAANTQLTPTAGRSFAGGAAGDDAPASMAPPSSLQLVSSPAGASGPGSSVSPPPAPASTSRASTVSVAPAAASVVAVPVWGSGDLPPTVPISITVHHATLTSLVMVNDTGKAVIGTFTSDHSRWTLGEVLGYGRTYTVSGTVVDGGGRTVRIGGTYRTLSPQAQVAATISPGAGKVVGVAAPIIVRFSSAPADRAAVQQRMKVSTVPAVEGSWAWITHDGDTYPSLDWRPKTYWPPYTKVHVEADIYGTAVAGGVYGAADVSSDFSIGRNQVVIADAKKFNIIVQRSGKTVATYPGSYGMGDDPKSRFGINPDLVTRSGIHIVMDKQQTVAMNNPKYGYTNSVEHWAVRISDNGEFIHENPNTVGDQGNSNVSHGCINLSAASAQAYYQTAIYGDPVQITGTSVDLSAADGDIYDWALSWPAWQALSAL